MNLSLLPELERLIPEKLEIGLYHCASEVVCEALRLFEKRDRLQALEFDEVRQAVQIGIEQADRGEVALLDIDGTLAKVRGRGRNDDGGA